MRSRKAEDRVIREIADFHLINRKYVQTSSIPKTGAVLLTYLKFQNENGFYFLVHNALILSSMYGRQKALVTAYEQGNPVY